ncbi:MAG: pitrilysin family protein [Steroidobacteraceae bacterium]
MLKPLLLSMTAALIPLAGCGTKSKVPVPAPASELLASVDIPYEQFKLDNGLTVLVHTDRKAPVVGVSVWYDVGTKHEPAGKTGFAHLFEHLMFNGTENVPGDFFEPLQQVGATDVNGTTWFDRTNYFETVPTPALDVALFLESDRMGHLLGAVSQKVLDNQRGVVQNEKRQGDNQPFGLVSYAQLAALLPSDHPYGHDTIGSMADLDNASLADVRQWFIDHYGPNNAILVLAGDIDAATAKPLVEKYFGDIPAGKLVAKVNVPVPTLPAAKSETMKDHVATTRLYRYWTVPGLTDPDAGPLTIGAWVLGGLASSRLDNTLVRQEQTAVRVSANYQDFAQLGFIEVIADVKPGVDADKVSARLDEIIGKFIDEGPTEDEVQRVTIRRIADAMHGLEAVGGHDGKAPTLAEGLLYAGDPGFYKKRLAASTPAEVRAAMQKWLKRPVYALRVEPGDRAAYQEAASVKPRKGAAAARGSAAANATAIAATPASAGRATGVDRSKLPDVGTIANVDFPDVETGKLSNGITVRLARRETLPTLHLSMVFNAGYAADPRDRLGTQALMLALLTEGTTSRSSVQIAEEQERLGANVSARASLDRTTVSLSSLTPNLGLSLDLLADIVKNPAFAPAELERLRATQLAAIAQENADPQGIARRTLPPLVFGAYPYGIPSSGSGDPAVVQKLTREDLTGFHQRWIRPDNVEILAVGRTTLPELLRELESRFGDWQPAAVPRGSKDFTAAIPARTERIVLVDRPQSPQSLILAGQVLERMGSDPLETLLAGNDVLGGNFLSRINMDLRETRGWSYGVRGSVIRPENRVLYQLRAPVQTDRTGESIAALKQHVRDFVGGKGVTAAELARTVNGGIRELAGSYETSDAVLGQMAEDVLYKRPSNYAETLADRYRAMDAAALDGAVRTAIDPNGFTWVVVGDKQRVLPQLQKLKIPVTVVEASANSH